MFGRLRPPPSSPDSLERYPAKLIKDDPLSVYESTLLKLKQGSKLDTVGSCPETEAENVSSPSSPNSLEASNVFSSRTDAHHDVTLCNVSDAMAIDSTLKQQKNKNPSVLSMFCRYKNLAQTQNSPHTVDTTETENDS